MYHDNRHNNTFVVSKGRVKMEDEEEEDCAPGEDERASALFQYPPPDGRPVLLIMGHKYPYTVVVVEWIKCSLDYVQ